MRWLVLAMFAALAAAAAASAAGPSPGVVLGHGGVSAGRVSYETVRAGAGTTLRVLRDGAPTRTVSLAGRWGVPLVTFGGEAGGVSHDGSTLVLVQATPFPGPLRSVSRLLVFDTKRLAAPTALRFRGDFGFDALSPDGRTLYLIQHMSGEDVTRYVVRAYDLRTKTLLARTIADKRQQGWVMRGFPARRAESPDGRWVYTLYQPQGNYPFVHALDTVSRSAVCIGLPWKWAGEGNDVWDASMTLSGGRLVVEDGSRRAVIDTESLRIVTSAG